MAITKRLLWLPLVAALLASIALVTFAPTPKLPEFAVLQSWPRERLTFRDRVDRIIPRQRSWSWAWKIEEFVFRKRKTVDISASVLSFKGGAADTCSVALGSPAFATSNHLNVWLLSTNEIKAFRKAFRLCAGSEVLNGANVSTASGMQAQVFCGETRGTNPALSAGLQMDFLAHKKTVHADLIVGAIYSEFETNVASEARESVVTVHTNLDTMFRIQLPSGKGLLMIDRNGANSNTFGILLNPL